MLRLWTERKLASRDAAVRLEALRALGPTYVRATGDRMRDTIASLREHTRVGGELAEHQVGVIRECAHGPDVERVRRIAVEDEDERVRAVAGETLRAIGAAMIPALVEALMMSDGPLGRGVATQNSVRNAAATELIAIGASARAALLDALARMADRPYYFESLEAAALVLDSVDPAWMLSGDCAAAAGRIAAKLLDEFRRGHVNHVDAATRQAVRVAPLLRRYPEPLVAAFGDRRRYADLTSLLEAIGGEHVEAALVASLADRDVGLQAARALRVLGWPPRPDRNGIEFALWLNDAELLRGFGDMAIEHLLGRVSELDERAIGLVGKVAGGRAAEPLLELLGHTDLADGRRRTILRALEEAAPGWRSLPLATAHRDAVIARAVGLGGTLRTAIDTLSAFGDDVSAAALIEGLAGMRSPEPPPNTSEGDGSSGLGAWREHERESSACSEDRRRAEGALRKISYSPARVMTILFGRLAALEHERRTASDLRQHLAGMLSAQLQSDDADDRAEAEGALAQALDSAPHLVADVSESLKRDALEALVRSYRPETVGRLISARTEWRIAGHVNWCRESCRELEAHLGKCEQAARSAKDDPARVPADLTRILRNAVVRREKDAIARIERYLGDLDEILETPANAVDDPPAPADVAFGDPAVLFDGIRRERAVFEEERVRRERVVGTLRASAKSYRDELAFEREVVSLALEFFRSRRAEYEGLRDASNVSLVHALIRAFAGSDAWLVETVSRSAPDGHDRAARIWSAFRDAMPVPPPSLTPGRG